MSTLAQMLLASYGGAPGGGGGGGADPHFASVSLLLRGDGADGAAPTDSSASARALTVIGSTQVDTGVPGPFGGGSVLFDGDGDALTTPNAAAWNLGATFTLECFLRLDARDTSGTFLLQRQGGGFEWWVDGTGTLRLNQNNTTALLVSPSGAVNVGTSWVHIATVGTGTGYRHFINGAQVATLTTAIVPADTSGALRVGGYDSSAAYDLAGRMALRITNGVARYTGAFTPPTDFPVS